MKLRAEAICKRYGPITALEPTDLAVQAGELLTVLGPSGSGKTTLLQLVSGLATPSSGRIYIDGQDHTTTPVHRRDIGLVFQNYALFPHLTVAENIAFPLRMRRAPEVAIRRQVEAALEMVQLGAYGARRPGELSGGQQQRVALARCFVYAPSVILMDEPLGALDKKLREHMQIEIKRLHRETGATILYVTHDQDEALALSDRICLMNHARVAQIGTPRDLYERPASIFAAGFIGLSTILRGTIGADGRLSTADGSFAVPGGAAPGPAALVLRPEQIAIGADAACTVTGQVAEAVYAGAETRLILTLGSGTAMTVRAPAYLRATIGETLTVGWGRESGVVIAE